MMDPGMQGAPLPEGMPGEMPMGMPMGMPMAPPSPVDAVIAALQGMEMHRQSEDDAVLAAVMKATGAGMPTGMDGVSEGPAFGAPMGDAGMGMNPDAMGDAMGGMGY